MLKTLAAIAAAGALQAAALPDSLDFATVASGVSADDNDDAGVQSFSNTPPPSRFTGSVQCTSEAWAGGLVDRKSSYAAAGALITSAGSSPPAPQLSVQALALLVVMLADAVDSLPH